MEGQQRVGELSELHEKLLRLKLEARTALAGCVMDIRRPWCMVGIT